MMEMNYISNLSPIAVVMSLTAPPRHAIDWTQYTYNVIFLSGMLGLFGDKMHIPPPVYIIWKRWSVIWKLPGCPDHCASGPFLAVCEQEVGREGCRPPGHANVCSSACPWVAGNIWSQGVHAIARFLPTLEDIRGLCCAAQLFHPLFGHPIIFSITTSNLHSMRHSESECIIFVGSGLAASSNLQRIICCLSMVQSS